MDAHDHHADIWRIAAILLDTYGVRMVTEAVAEASLARAALTESDDAVPAGDLWGEVFEALLELLKARPEAGDHVH